MIQSSVMPVRRIFRAMIAAVLAIGLSGAAISVSHAQTTPPKSKVKQAASKPVAKAAPRSKKAQTASRTTTTTPTRKLNRYASLVVDAQTGQVLHDTGAERQTWEESLADAAALRECIENLACSQAPGGETENLALARIAGDLSDRHNGGRSPRGAPVPPCYQPRDTDPPTPRPPRCQGDSEHHISIWLPSSTTLLGGMRKKSMALAALRDCEVPWR